MNSTQGGIGNKYARVPIEPLGQSRLTAFSITRTVAITVAHLIGLWATAH